MNRFPFGLAATVALSVLCTGTLRPAPRQPGIGAGTRVYVMAVSGLKLRSTPSLQGAVIAVLPSGTEATIVDATGKADNCAGTPGAWRKIQSAGKTGFACDTFLTRFPIPANPPSQDPRYQGESVFHFYARIYLGDASANVDTRENSAITSTLTLKNARPEEAYAILRVLQKDEVGRFGALDRDESRRDEDDVLRKVTIERNLAGAIHTISFTFTYPGGDVTHVIAQQGDDVILTSHSEEP